MRALDLIARSYRKARQGDATWRGLNEQARQLCPEVCVEVVHGRRAGTIPTPGTAQWADYVDRRTGTTRAAREQLLQPTPDKPSGTRKQKRRANPPPDPTPRRPRGALGSLTHGDLAGRWQAVRGHEISTTTLAVLLGYNQHQARRQARVLDGVLEEPPWRLRVRAGKVDGRQLQERCDDLLNAIAYDL